MNIKAVIKHFGGVRPTARALNIKSAGAVVQWQQAGVIPELRQYQIEVLSGGKFRAGRKSASRLRMISSGS